jgi:integrase
MFTGRWGAPLEAGRDSRLWKSLLERAQVRHVRLHDARHTAGTLMNANGTDPRTIQRILGHADVHTTLTYYVKPTETLVAEAGARMADLVRATK